MGGFKIGQLLGKHVTVYVGTRGAMTLFDGDKIGTSFAAIDPSQPAEQFQASNLAGIDLRLDRDWLSLGGGVIYKKGDVELQGAFNRILWGHNIPAINTISLSTIVVLPNVTGETLDKS